jgi:hypothetical protein
MKYMSVGELVRFNPELQKKDNYPNIHFEAGNHEYKYGTQKGWNPEIKTVLADYSPKVLAIDGAIPSSPALEFQWNKSELGQIGKQKEFSPKNEEVFLVFGDTGLGKILRCISINGFSTKL